MSQVSVRLSSTFTKDQVLALVRKHDRDGLVEFIKQRHHERYFFHLESLKRRRFAGFAMMSLSCLLIETLQSYKEGYPSTNAKENRRLGAAYSPPPEYAVPAGNVVSGRQVFKDFFTQYKTLFCAIDGSDFYDNVRNGLLHQAQTKNGWTLNNHAAQLWDKQTRNVNRDMFVDRLQAAFNLYLTDLRFLPQNHPLWLAGRRKLWWLATLS